MSDETRDAAIRGMIYFRDGGSAEWAIAAIDAVTAHVRDELSAVSTPSSVETSPAVYTCSWRDCKNGVPSEDSACDAHAGAESAYEEGWKDGKARGEHSRDAEVAELRKQVEEERARVRWFVEHAADQKLDGYRELGARAASAENERDALRADLAKVRDELDASQWRAGVAELSLMTAETERDNLQAVSDECKRQHEASYREGAEAMRQRAVEELLTLGYGPHDTAPTRIRALSLDPAPVAKPVNDEGAKERIGYGIWCIPPVGPEHWLRLDTHRCVWGKREDCQLAIDVGHYTKGEPTGSAFELRGILRGDGCVTEPLPPEPSAQRWGVWSEDWQRDSCGDIHTFTRAEAERRAAYDAKEWPHERFTARPLPPEAK